MPASGWRVGRCGQAFQFFVQRNILVVVRSPLSKEETPVVLYFLGWRKLPMPPAEIFTSCLV